MNGYEQDNGKDTHMEFSLYHNGDATALTDDEVQTIDRWMKRWQVQDVSPLTDEEGNAQPYFTHYPLFGLPTEVEDCEILYLNDNPTKI